MKTVSNAVRHNLMLILFAVWERNRGEIRIVWNASASSIVRGLIDDGYVSAHLDSDDDEPLSILFLLVSEPERFTLTDQGYDLMLWVAGQVLEQKQTDERARLN